MVNSVKLKIFLVIFSLTENSAKNDWNHFRSLFSLQTFSSSLSHTLLSHTRTASLKAWLLRPTNRAKRNDPHRRTTIAISPVTGTASIDVDRDRDSADRRRSRSRQSRAKCRSRSRNRDRADRNRDRDLTFSQSFLGFICVFRNEWHYVFVW